MSTTASKPEMTVMKEEHSLGRLGRQAKFWKEVFLHQAHFLKTSSLGESVTVKMAAVLPFHHVQQHESTRTNTGTLGLLQGLHLTMESK